MAHIESTNWSINPNIFVHISKLGIHYFITLPIDALLTSCHLPMYVLSLISCCNKTLSILLDHLNKFIKVFDNIMFFVCIVAAHPQCQFSNVSWEYGIDMSNYLEAQPIVCKRCEHV